QSGAAETLAGPYRPGDGPGGAPADPVLADERPYLSRRVLGALEETREPVLAGNMPARSDAKNALDLTMGREVMPLWVVACPLPHGDDALEALYVTLPPECGSV